MRTRTWLFGASLFLIFACEAATADDPPLMKSGFGDVELHLLAKLAEDGNVEGIREELDAVRKEMATYYRPHDDSLRKAGVAEGTHFGEIADDLQALLNYYDEARLKQIEQDATQTGPGHPFLTTVGYNWEQLISNDLLISTKMQRFMQIDEDVRHLQEALDAFKSQLAGLQAVPADQLTADQKRVLTSDLELVIDFERLAAHWPTFVAAAEKVLRAGGDAAEAFGAKLQQISKIKDPEERHDALSKLAAETETAAEKIAVDPSDAAGEDVVKKFVDGDGNAVPGVQISFTNRQGTTQVATSDAQGNVTLPAGSGFVVAGGPGVQEQPTTASSAGSSAQNQPTQLIVPQSIYVGFASGHSSENPAQTQQAQNALRNIVTMAIDPLLKGEVETPSASKNDASRISPVYIWPVDVSGETSTPKPQNNISPPAYSGPIIRPIITNSGATPTDGHFTVLWAKIVPDKVVIYPDTPSTQTAPSGKTAKPSDQSAYDPILPKLQAHVENELKKTSDPALKLFVQGGSLIEVQGRLTGKAEAAPAEEAAHAAVDPAELLKVAYGGPRDPFFLSSGSWGRPYADQWAIQRVGYRPIGGTQATAWGDSPQKIALAELCVVAVIGSGVDWTHPDLAMQMWNNEKEVPGNGEDDDGNGFVDDVLGWNFLDDSPDVMDRGGHDTHIAGVIGAAWNGLGIAGINPQARIMALKVADFRAETNTVAVSRAIFYAVDHGARVINISYGGVTSPLMQLAIDHAAAKGAVVIVAAGNEGDDTIKHGPANCRNAITVAGATVDDKRVKFSNWGQAVDLAAPAMDVLSLRAGGTDFLLYIADRNPAYKAGTAIVGEDKSLYRSSGTSFAAPIVAGTASLLFSQRPDLTGEQVRRMLLMSADDLETPGWDQYTGYGMLNARQALAADPDYYQYARIHRVSPVRQGNRMVVEVEGQVEGSDFAGRWLQIGFGAAPANDAWKTIAHSEKPVSGGTVGTIAMEAFDKPGQWTVRLLSQDKQKRVRQSRASINLTP